MTDQRRVVLAFLLMALVLGVTQWWYSQYETEPPVDELTETAVENPSVGVDPEAVEIEAEPASAPRQPDDSLAAQSEPGPPSSQRPPRQVVERPPVSVETPLYRMEIDPRGGVLRQVTLLEYPSYTGPGPARLVPDGAGFLERTVDLGREPWPLGEYSFEPSEREIRLERGDPPATLELVSDGGGTPIRQTFRFDPDTYVVDYALDLGTDADGSLATRLGPRLESNEKNVEDDYNQLRAVARSDGEILSRKPGDVDDGDVLTVDLVDWAGLKSKYFVAVLLADEGEPLTATRVSGEEGDSLPQLDVVIGAPIEEGRAEHRFYIGPQSFDRLSNLNDGLDDVNQYGWSWIRWMITPFAKLCVIVMLWLHQFIPSYGVVLIVFAVLVRVLMWPLTSKSYRSIQAIQKLQPELQRIKEQYKSDPQRMQKETMALYREKKVNPLGGCLPNLIPMPILFALFFVFQGTIEFRGQSFLWLPDLSQPDPFYLLPLFMGATIFVSSKMTATDPKMAAMTYVMPVVLTFVFLNLAAGLVFYYALSNLLTVAQQWMLKRVDDSGDPEVAPT